MQYECDYGKTQIGYIGRVPVTEPKLQTYFPTCIGGLLIAEKDGYLPQQEQVTILPGDPETPGHVDIYMTPLRNLEYSFKVKELDSTGNLIQTRNLKDDEMVYLSIYNKEKDYTVTIVYPNDLPDEINMYKELELLNGDYEYELVIRLLKDDEVIGGFELPDWRVSSNELISSNKIGFSLLVRKPIPSSTEQMAMAWRDVIAPASKKVMYRPVIS